MSNDRNLTNVDSAILTVLKDGETTQADLVKRLLTITGESYLYSRIRTLQYRGLLKKVGGSAYQAKVLSLTPEGLAQVTQVNPRKPVPSQGA